jgi:hypothetical protein
MSHACDIAMIDITSPGAAQRRSCECGELTLRTFSALSPGLPLRRLADKDGVWRA